MNLVRTGGAALVGLGSGVLNPAIVPGGLPILGVTFGYDSLFEAAALAAGALGQAFVPNTLPNLMDGVVDGGVALVSRRLTTFGVQAIKTGKVGTAFYEADTRPYRINGAMYGGVHDRAPRGSNTTLTGLARARAH